jgi:tetratricopeptide (TPR) repeat protein
MTSPAADHPTEPGANAPESQRLVSWKEIAAYFNCDVRTVKRWEQERGLPVHRVPGGERSRVFAYTTELQAWLHAPPGASETASQPPPSGDLEAAPIPDTSNEEAVTNKESPPPSAQKAQSRSGQTALLGLFALLILAAGGYGIYRLRSAHAQNKPAYQGGEAAAPLPAARELYLKGRFYLEKRTSESLTQAVDDYTQAIVLDSNYAEAYAGLAECYDLMPEYIGMPEAEAMPRAIAAARKAILLNESLPNAHSALAFALFWYQWDFKDAEPEYRRAIELDPRNVEAHHWYATALAGVKRYPDALREIDLAQQLDPASRSIVADQAWILYNSGSRDDAMARLEQLQAAEPDFFSPPHYLAKAYFNEENYPAYIAELKLVAAATRKDFDYALADAAASGWAQGGRRGLLGAIRSVYEKRFAAGKDDGEFLARICARLGDREAAVKYLNAATAVREYEVREALSNRWAPQLNGFPPFEAFRSSLRKQFASGESIVE